mmetsp:Transcript_85388/g.245192  ORF Transcript_85388/g.245192 Transcript_85388/m.245192 type:complete len:208 (-) Transcript_85388:398-1021(-)
MPSLLLLCTSLLEGLHALHHRLLHAVRPRHPIWSGAGAPVHGRRRQLMIHREFLQCRRIMPIGIFDALEVEVDIAAPELLLVLTRSLVALDLGHKVLLAVRRDRPSGGPQARCRQPRPLRCGGLEATKVGGEACGARQANGLLSKELHELHNELRRLLGGVVGATAEICAKPAPRVLEAHRFPLHNLDHLAQIGRRRRAVGNWHPEA